MSGIRRKARGRKRKAQNSSKEIPQIALNNHVGSPQQTQNVSIGGEISAKKAWGITEKLALWSLLITVFLGAVAVATPEVRKWVGLDHEEEKKAQPQAEPPKKQEEPSEPKPERPQLRYVPLPHGDPFDKPRNFVTSVPKNGEQEETVSISGEAIPVLTQKDLTEVLDHKLTVEDFETLPSKADFFVVIRKDGTVDDVKAANGNSAVFSETEEKIRTWKFQPFVKDGETVPVQTMIQLNPHHR